MEQVEQIVRGQDSRLGFAVMIFDYNMPLISGPKLMRKVKRVYKKYGIPDEELPKFILITGQEQEGEMDADEVAKFAAVMMKPASFTQLTELLKNAKCI